MDTTITAVLREAEKQTEELLALEDTGWMNLSTSASGQTDPERQLSVRRARLFFARDPLARQAIRLWTDYTFGPGLTWNLEKGASRDAFEAFWSGPGNTTVLNSAGQRKSSDKLLVDGEIFFALFFTDPPKLRRVDPLEITEIISDEDDADDVRYFKREWTTPFSTSKTGIYKSLGNTDDKAAKDVYGNLVTATEQDVVMLHLPINTIGLRGNSTLLPALDWIKLYRQFLASRVAIMLALARFAWKGKLSGNQATVDTAAAKIQDASPKAGSTWIENQGMDLQPIHTDTGAANAKEDARALRLQICAATGIPEQYFGDVSCYAADTQALTDHGWMAHADWHPGIKVASYNPDTKGIEYIEPVELRRFPYSGQMVHFKSANVDILVTPNHRMWAAHTVGWQLKPARQNPPPNVRLRASEGGHSLVNRAWQFYEAQHMLVNPLTHGWRIVNHIEPAEAGTIQTPFGQPDTCAWAQFLGYWLSEGYCLDDTKRNGGKRDRVYYRVGISQKPGATLERMRRLLPWLGYKYHEQVNQGGVVTLTITDKKLWTYLRDQCGRNSHDKRIPRECQSWPIAERSALFAALIEGDGGFANGQHTGGLRWSSVSETLANDMMELALSLGYTPSIVPETRQYMGQGRLIWRAAIRKGYQDPLIKPRNVTSEAHDGEVFCFALPKNHIYITRRNGKVAIQGNTGNLATAQTVELPLQKMFTSYQTVWADLYRQIANAVMLNANVEPLPVDFDFPAITPEDSGVVAASIAQLLVVFPDLANSPDVLQQALMSIGINNVQAVIDSLSKESRDPAVVAAEALRKFRVMLEAKNGHV